MRKYCLHYRFIRSIFREIANNSVIFVSSSICYYVVVTSEAKGVTRHTWSVRLHPVLYHTIRVWFIVLSWCSLIPRDRNLDWGYLRSLPISTFRHSRTRYKSSPWVIARRISSCARINVLDVLRVHRASVLSRLSSVIISWSPRVHSLYTF